MRILLRNKTSGLYLQGPDKWTKEPERAVDFRFMDRALAYVQTWHLREAELAFSFDGGPAQVARVSVEKAALQCGAP
jgi:hypothetical protein